VHDRLPRLTESALALLRRAAPREDLRPALDTRRRALAEMLPGVDVVIAAARFVAERVRDSGLPVAPRVLSLGAVSAPAVARAPGPRPRVAFVGAVAPHKGVHVLIDAFRGLPGADLRLDIHGSLTLFPSYVHDLRRRAAGDARIRFAGQFPEAEQARLFASFDVLVLPSLWWETTGLVGLEALAAGRVVIASRSGGMPEALGEAGVLVPPGDVEALRQALADVTSGRLHGGAAPPPAVKTAEDGADELIAIYASLIRG
jgi:glycosyltransferase involved in cell wall biosynthesis